VRDGDGAAPPGAGLAAVTGVALGARGDADTAACAGPVSTVDPVDPVDPVSTGDAVDAAGPIAIFGVDVMSGAAGRAVGAGKGSAAPEGPAVAIGRRTPGWPEVGSNGCVVSSGPPSVADADVPTPIT
jgi:hypothetical protein